MSHSFVFHELRSEKEIKGDMKTNEKALPAVLTLASFEKLFAASSCQSL